MFQLFQWKRALGQNAYMCNNIFWMYFSYTGDVDRLFEQIFAELSPHGSNEERGFIEELWSPLSPALSGLSSDEVSRYWYH